MIRFWNWLFRQPTDEPTDQPTDQSTDQPENITETTDRLRIPPPPKL